jgi:hypothetical protein
MKLKALVAASVLGAVSVVASVGNVRAAPSLLFTLESRSVRVALSPSAVLIDTVDGPVFRSTSTGAPTGAIPGRSLVQPLSPCAISASDWFAVPGTDSFVTARGRSIVTVGSGGSVQVAEQAGCADTTSRRLVGVVANGNLIFSSTTASSSFIEMISPTGVINLAFGTNGRFNPLPASGPGGRISAVVTTPGGDGLLVLSSGVAGSRLVRLGLNGEVVASFVGSIDSVTALNDGRVVLSSATCLAKIVSAELAEQSRQCELPRSGLIFDRPIDQLDLVGAEVTQNGYVLVGSASSTIRLFRSEGDGLVLDSIISALAPTGFERKISAVRAIGSLLVLVGRASGRTGETVLGLSTPQASLAPPGFVPRPSRAPGARLAAGETIEVRVSDIPGGLDRNGWVLGNITMTDNAAPGFVSLFAPGFPVPTTSSLNTDMASQTRANAAFALVGSGGTVSLLTSQPSHLVVDVSGVLPVGGLLQNSRRILDTRSGLGVAGGVAGLLQPGQAITLRVNPSGLNVIDFPNVALNVTATQTSGPGVVQVSTGLSVSRAPHVTFTRRDQNVANLVVTPTNDRGEITVTASAATHVVIDTIGAFPGTAIYQGVEPVRIASAAVLNDRETVSVMAAGVGRAPIGATAVVVVLRADRARAGGFITAYATGTPRPNVSSLNLSGPGDAVSNTAVVPVNADGSFDVFTYAGASITADLVGWFPSGSSFRAVTPTRLLDTRG